MGKTTDLPWCASHLTGDQRIYPHEPVFKPIIPELPKCIGSKPRAKEVGLLLVLPVIRTAVRYAANVMD